MSVQQHLCLHHIPDLHYPPDCKHLDVPTLSMETEVAHDTFHRIYDSDSDQLNTVNTELQARVWYKQHRPEVARSEALRAAQVHEKLGAVEDEECRKLLRDIEKELRTPAASGQPDFYCELL